MINTVNRFDRDGDCGCGRGCRCDHDDDDDDEDHEPVEELHDNLGNVIWSRSYEGQFVDLVCQGCGRAFRGMPDHGFCGDCADKRERGWDFE